jgi:hypothetical protein
MIHDIIMPPGKEEKLWTLRNNPEDLQRLFNTLRK